MCNVYLCVMCMCEACDSCWCVSVRGLVYVGGWNANASCWCVRCVAGSR